MKILIKNGRVIDPCNEKDEITDILIENSKIKEISKNIRLRNDDDILIVNAINKIVTPGLIDVHVHFREPGFENKETIKTGSRAAVMGGFTTVVCEPNTDPPIDSSKKVRKVLEVAKKNSIVNLKTKACISLSMKGERLVNVNAVHNAGAVAISDDGHPVGGSKLMRNALLKAKENYMVVNPHCEESEFYRGKMSKKNGDSLFSSPYSKSTQKYTSEQGLIERDIELVRKIKCPLHISHVSFKDSVIAIRKAKKDGLPITAEATPHHFSLTADDIPTDAGGNFVSADFKVNPPLRSISDREALLQGLKDNIIEVIATDHAPHAPDEKAIGWDNAPFGIIGLETSLGIVMTRLVHEKNLSMYEAVAKMASNPARIFGLDAGNLSIGARADITIIDPFKEWIVDANKFESKGRNCPFNGWNLKGKAYMTIVNGQIVMEEGVIIEDQLEYFTKHLAHNNDYVQAAEEMKYLWSVTISQL